MPHQTAETLRAMAQEQQEYADALHFDQEDAALNTARKAACEAGARAWEILSDIDFAVKADDHEALANLYLVVRALLYPEGR